MDTGKIVTPMGPGEPPPSFVISMKTRKISHTKCAIPRASIKLVIPGDSEQRPSNGVILIETSKFVNPMVPGESLYNGAIL